jgi:hypothetical protein
VEGRRIAFWRAPISERRSENLSRTKCRGLSDQNCLVPNRQAKEPTPVMDSCGESYRVLHSIVDKPLFLCASLAVM